MFGFNARNLNFFFFNFNSEITKERRRQEKEKKKNGKRENEEEAFRERERERGKKEDSTAKAAICPATMFSHLSLRAYMFYATSVCMTIGQDFMFIKYLFILLHIGCNNILRFLLENSQDGNFFFFSFFFFIIFEFEN